MKLKIGTVIAVSLLIITNSCSNNMAENPLLVKSQNQYEAPAFNKIKEEHYNNNAATV